MNDRLIGQRIREHRTRQGRAQAIVADLCGITEDYLSRIERGVKVPTLAVLMAIAHELDVPVGVLMGEKPSPSRTPDTAGRTGRQPGLAETVAGALLGYGPPPSRAASIEGLRHRIEAAWQVWQTSSKRFTEVTGVLPGLISDVETALRASYSEAERGQRIEAHRCAADLYFLLRSYCRRVGRTDLSLMVADRAARSAEESGDPISIAAAQWNLGQILLGTGEYDAAVEVAVRGIEQIGRHPANDAEAMAGALHLVAAIGENRCRRAGSARERLRKQAMTHGRRVGDGNVMHTVFGPTNVLLHAVSMEMEAGESTEALRLAEDIDTSALPLERRFTFVLEVARCYDLRREDAAVLVHLLDAEQLAGEDLARSPLAVQMITDLRSRVRATYRRQVSELASRMGID